MLRYLRMGNKRTKMIWWALIVVTVVTFVGGFVFLFGAGLDSTQRARMSGSVGTVNGEKISRDEYNSALEEQRATYMRQYNTQPTEQDQRVVELQAWRGIVSEHLMNDVAHQAGLAATDKEVVLAMRSNPPQLVLTQPIFQTDGKFDPQKYQSALANPNVNWSPFENLARAQIPMRKLQERLISSLKISEAELREMYRDQTERVSATVLQVPGNASAKLNPPTDADLQRTYDQYKSRFVTGPRTQVEVLSIPRHYSEEELRQAREMAASLADRARKGEDFGQLAKDYSEGPGADQGGAIQQVLPLQQLGPDLGPKLMALPVGGITDPVQDAGRFLVFKVIERVMSGPNGTLSGFKLAQIVIKTKPGDAEASEQIAQAQKIRDRAKAIGLGKAAAEKGLATRKSEPFDFNNPPQSLFMVPQASEWALNQKVGAVSPVMEGVDEYMIVQVAEQTAAGPAPRQSITEPLRQISELVARVDASKPKADSVAALLKAGRTLEEAAKITGAQSYKADLTRAQPDPRLSASDDVVGALFAAKPGQVVGPYRALNGWYFARLDNKVSFAPMPFDSVRNQISSQILQQRQRSFMNGYMADLRGRAKVEDLRSDQ